jgi:hypothetical protein
MLVLASAAGLTALALVAPAAASASVKPAPALSAGPLGIVGGGGWEYTDTLEGNCGTAAIGVNDNGDGHIVVQGQLISSLGPIAGGSVSLVWNAGGKAGSKAWQPVAANGNWTSPDTNFTVPQHEKTTVILTGFIELADGDTCSIENPYVSFTSS